LFRDSRARNDDHANKTVQRMAGPPYLGRVRTSVEGQPSLTLPFGIGAHCMKYKPRHPVVNLIGAIGCCAVGLVLIVWASETLTTRVFGSVGMVSFVFRRSTAFIGAPSGRHWAGSASGITYVTCGSGNRGKWLKNQRLPNMSLDRMTRSAADRMFHCERPWRAPRHRSA